MYPKLNYIIRIILILGIGLGIYSYLNMMEYIESLPEFYPALCLAGLIVIVYLLSKKLKTKSRILHLTLLGMAIVFLLLTTSLTLTHFSAKRNQNMLTEYGKLSCEELKKRFEIDLQENNLKHFSLGMGWPRNLSKNLRKYNIDNFSLSCHQSGSWECYSKLVREHLKETENVEIDIP